MRCLSRVCVQLSVLWVLFSCIDVVYKSSGVSLLVLVFMVEFFVLVLLLVILVVCLWLVLDLWLVLIWGLAGGWDSRTHPRSILQLLFLRSRLVSGYSLAEFWRCFGSVF